MKSVSAFFLLTVAGVANAYFQPDDLIPSPRYVSNDIVTYPSIDATITHLNFDMWSGRVNAPTGGSTVVSPFANNYTEFTLIHNFTGQGFAVQSSGQISIHDAGSGEYVMEMLQFTMGFPFGMMIRESPTIASIGHSTLVPTTDGYLVTSFFDIYTEVSGDGGQTWVPATGPIRVVGETPEPGSILAITAGLGVLSIRRRKKG